MGCSASTASPAIAQAQERSKRTDALEDLCYSPSKAKQAKQDLCYSSSSGDDFHRKYLLGDKLSMGAFAQVRVGIPADDACVEFAVKIVNLTTDSVLFAEEKQNALKCAHTEEIMLKLVGRHDNCAHLFEAFHGNLFSYMVMEKCSTCLLRHIYHMPKVNERTLGPLFAGMLRGLAHVHSVGVVHRDVKSESFMIGQDGCTVKLCDFGLSETLDGSGKMSGIFGTAPYMCPEMVRGSDYDGRADVWSVGVIVYAFMFGTFPYMPKEKEMTSKATMKAILVGTTPKFEPVIFKDPAKDGFRTDSALSFAKALLTRYVELRPTAASALKMQFMQDSIENRHELGTQLPSLRYRWSDKHIGAFEVRNLQRQDDVDHMLNDLQIMQHGLPIFSVQASHSTQRVKSVHWGATEGSSRSDGISSDCSTYCPSGSSSLNTLAQGSLRL